MNLNELDIQEDYRSDRDNLINDFYIPCLKRAAIYSRAVGFFSSSSLVAVSKGITALINSGGKIQLVASPCLSLEDIKAIETGLKQREEVITKAILRELDREFETVIRDRLACLASGLFHSKKCQNMLQSITTMSLCFGHVSKPRLSIEING